ncbi:hypothetical protein SELMODRAFT_426568 [Selaginella moellendorffii]|uniref:Protein kinase domain-containing protein n=1 Tax=Selaginella moellendorffii TaxID=88036 RepID=D8SWS6_SELML|nr:hypothetical protein SELMODRAFT_426568 [Selaginella moellendorffii]
MAREREREAEAAAIISKFLFLLVYFGLMSILPREQSSYLDLENAHQNDGRIVTVQHAISGSTKRYSVGPVAEMFARNVQKLLTNLRADIERHPNRWQIRQCVREPDDSCNDLGKVYQHAARLVLDRAEKRRKDACAKKKVALGAEGFGLPIELFSQVENEIRVREILAASGCKIRIPEILWSGTALHPFGWRNCPIVLVNYVGESLHSKTLPIRDAAKMGASLLETVLELHKRGIIHRNISPRNVAYREQGVGLERFHLLDFGIAAISSDNGGSVGSSSVKDLEFRSMNSVLGNSVDASADLEGILYTMVKVAGMDLPWSTAAQEEDEDLVVTIRRQVLDQGFLAEFKDALMFLDLRFTI